MLVVPQGIWPETERTSLDSACQVPTDPSRELGPPEPSATDPAGSPMLAAPIPLSPTSAYGILPKPKGATMVVLALLILNKSGGLIYNRNFHQGLSPLSSNDYLVLAGTFHGVHAITSLISPAKAPPVPGPSMPAGLEVLESEMFRMQCFQTMTGWSTGILGFGHGD